MAVSIRPAKARNSGGFRAKGGDYWYPLTLTIALNHRGRIAGVRRLHPGRVLAEIEGCVRRRTHRYRQATGKERCQYCSTPREVKKCAAFISTSASEFAELQSQPCRNVWMIDPKAGVGSVPQEIPESSYVSEVVNAEGVLLGWTSRRRDPWCQGVYVRRQLSLQCMHAARVHT